ncbi:MAG TPA: hypothetical protein VNX66_16775 [Candidatus Sulfotelmatobacter sp.]|jgi:hypothetical protein|nr:hypothetical protein [Candidatus Sulfotelmatobacter sp.]
MMRHGMEDEEKHDGQVRKFSGPLVMVKRFYALTEALLAKSVLDSAGMASLLTDEDVVQWMYPNLVGGLKLMVRPEDLESAVQLLSQTSAEENSLQEETALEELLRKAARPTESGDKRK